MENQHPTERPVIWYRIGTPDPVEPSDPLPPLPRIARGAIVVVEGRAPIWRYAMAFHALHGSAASAVCTYDPRLGAVVTASHVKDIKEGTIFDLSPPE